LTIQGIDTVQGEPLTERPGASEQRRERLFDKLRVALSEAEGRSEALAGAGGGAPAQTQ
jgi:hypothetical protein